MISGYTAYISGWENKITLPYQLAQQCQTTKRRYLCGLQATQRLVF